MNKNRITELFGIKYPIIQGGMVWISGWRLASAVSNAGGLGLLGAGSMHPDLHVGDLVIAMGACTDSNYVAQYALPGSYSPIAHFNLLRKAADTCDRLGYRYKVGNVFSSDIFYSENPQHEKWMNMGVLAVEMEAAALYMNAARAGKRALTICTISDHLLTGEVTTAEERQTTFTHMMDVAFSLV